MKEIAERMQEYRDHRYWFMGETLHIADERKEIVPLRSTESQDMEHNVIHQIRDVHKQMVRVQILKARQTYTTTATAADAFAEAWLAPGPTRVSCITDLQDHTANVRRMIGIFSDKHPIQRPSQMNHSTGTWTLKDSGAFFESMTAGTDTSGRSSTITYLHVSEAAFYPANGEEMMLGLLKSVPKLPGTTVVIESTAHGFDPVFQPRWSKSVERALTLAEEFGAADQYDLLFNITGWGDKPDKNGQLHPNGYWDGSYFPLFIAWFKMAKYRRDPALERLTPAMLSDYEKTIMARYKLDLWQMAYRRYDIREECGGDPVYSDDDPACIRFQQEMPCSPEEAFTSTSKSVFDQRVITVHLHRTQILGRMIYEKNGKKVRAIQPAALKWLVPPRFESMSGAVTNKDKLKVQAYKDASSGLMIFRGPKSDGYTNRYVIGVDSAMGNVHSHWSTAAVIDNVTGLRVAQFRGRIAPKAYGVFLAQLGYYYDEAQILVEVNYPGNAVIDSLLEYYTNVMERNRPDERFSGEPVKEYGFQTNDKTKHYALDLLDNSIKRQPHNFPFSWMWEEARTFVHYNSRQMGPEGKQKNEDTANYDDVIMSNAIAEVACIWAAQPFKDVTREEPQWYKDMYGLSDGTASVLDEIPAGVNVGRVL